MSVDNDEARPLKWLRTAAEPHPGASTTDTSSDLDNLQRHEEFWFDDGSIVLVARRKTGFRIYRALLAAQSTVFADTFASSSPSAEEMIEGCPVVYLSDTPEDITHFLCVLLTKSQRLLCSRKTTFSFHQISAVIRLAHKYHVQDVLDQAIESLQEHFPSNFGDWTSEPESIVRLRPNHAIGVVSLAKLVDRPLLLPTAFYRCALLGGEIMDGFRREDKTVERLRRSDIKRCIDGRTQLAYRAISVISEVFASTPSPCEACAARDRCRSALQKMLELVVDDDFASGPDVLASWAGRIREWAVDLSLCHWCKKEVIARDLRARRRVWSELPDIFDLTMEGWVTSEDGGDTSGSDTD